MWVPSIVWYSLICAFNPSPFSQNPKLSLESLQTRLPSIFTLPMNPWFFLWVQQITSPLWLLYHLDQQVINSVLKDIAGLLCPAALSFQQMLEWLNSSMRTRAYELEAMCGARQQNRIFKYSNCKRRSKKNVGLILDTSSHLTSKNEEKAEAFSVFLPQFTIVTASWTVRSLKLEDTDRVSSDFSIHGDQNCEGSILSAQSS